MDKPFKAKGGYTMKTFTITYVRQAIFVKGFYRDTFQVQGAKAAWRKLKALREDLKTPALKVWITCG